MANGRIDVYFHSSGDGESTEEEAGKTSADGEATTPKSNKNDTARSMIKSMAISYAKKGLSYGTSIYADMTGDYQVQRTIDGVVSTASTLYMMAQFPVGTIAGAFQIATNVVSTIVNIKNDNLQAAKIRERTGNEAINNSEVDSL